MYSLKRPFQLLLPVCFAFGIAPALAHATPGPKYVSLRNRHHCDRSLAYTTIQTNPAQYTGRVFELRGIIGGTAQTGGAITVMLNMPDKNEVTLDLPASEATILQESSTPSVRILAEVEDGGSGNVVPLKVLAMAHESEVAAIEAQDRAVYSAHQRSRRQTFATRTQVAYPSRGSYMRTGSLSGFTDIPSILARLPRLGERAQPLFGPYFNYIRQENPKLSLGQAAEITYGLLNFADHHEVDPRLVVAMVIAESGFDPNSTSHSGAMGLGQLMPGTARSLGVNNPYDPIQNLDGSIAYLREHLNNYASFGDKLPGSNYTFEQVALTMSAYNAGPNAVKKYGGVPPYRETQAYVRRVIAKYKELCSAG